MAADNQPKSSGLGPPGPNPLFFGVLLALIVGVAAAVEGSGTKSVLGSNLVFRIVVGGISFVVAYGIVAALWFAWHRRTFKGVNLAGVGAQAPEQLESETTARDDEIAEFMRATTAAIDDLNRRMNEVE